MYILKIIQTDEKQNNKNRKTAASNKTVFERGEHFLLKK